MNARPTRFYVAAALLALSVTLYVTSLTMRVAHVTGTVALHSGAIRDELVADLRENASLDAISDQIASVVNDVIRDKFPVFGSTAMFRMVRDSVREKVAERGPAMIEEVVPDIDVPQPPPDTYGVRLLQTIKDLWNTGTTGDAFLAVCITMFTIFFPVTKYVALTWLIVARPGDSSRERVLGWLKSWGQWSMGDVFVVAFMVVFMKINTSVVSTSNLADISVRVGVEPGLYLFAASVMLAMICSILVTKRA